MIIQVNILFSEKFLTSVGYTLKVEFDLLFQAYLCPQDVLKRYESFWDSFVCSGKTGLFGFINGLSSFCGFIYPNITYPFTPNTLLLSRTTMRVPPRLPLVIPWFLRGILGEINPLGTGVSDSPTSFPSSQGIFPKSSISLLHGWICNSFGTLVLFMSQINPL
jgi:hypothetical protein